MSQVASWCSQGCLLEKVLQKPPGAFSRGAATVPVGGAAGRGCSLRALDPPAARGGDSGRLPRSPWQLCRRNTRPPGLGRRVAGTGGVPPPCAGIAGQPPCRAPLWPHCLEGRPCHCPAQVASVSVCQGRSQGRVFVPLASACEAQVVICLPAAPLALPLPGRRGVWICWCPGAPARLVAVCVRLPPWLCFSRAGAAALRRGGRFRSRVPG